jgi:catechol 2,3-dioxygenase-like lactoylglutathione lyase family enzyme
MAKIRHIAYRVQDAEAMAKFFIEAFEMKIAQRRGEGVIDLTDGTLNISLLPLGRVGHPTTQGIEHIGFTAPDNEAAKRKVIAAGGKEQRTLDLGNANYEVKFEGPEGIIVDIGEWAGTEPVEKQDTFDKQTA